MKARSSILPSMMSSARNPRIVASTLVNMGTPYRHASKELATLIGQRQECPWIQVLMYVFRSQPSRHAVQLRLSCVLHHEHCDYRAAVNLHSCTFFPAIAFALAIVSCNKARREGSESSENTLASGL